MNDKNSEAAENAWHRRTLDEYLDRLDEEDDEEYEDEDDRPVMDDPDID